MAVATAAGANAARLTRPRYGSMSRDRTWALRWSYFFLVLFAIFFLLPPDLHDDHVAQDQRGDLGRDQPLVGLPSDAWRTTRGCSPRPNT